MSNNKLYDISELIEKKYLCSSSCDCPICVGKMVVYCLQQDKLDKANERIFALEKFTMIQNSDVSILEQIISAKKNNEKLADKISELEKLAEDWMNCYQKLKDKYEPEIFVTSGELKEGEK